MEGSPMKPAKRGKEQKKLCIVGTYEPTLKDVPFDDDSYEIWGMSSLVKRPNFAKRLDRAFEFHPERYWGQLNVKLMLREFDGPVYMQEHNEEIPNSVRYPYEEVREKFYIPAMGGNLYVTNSITWIILLGLHEGFKDFTILGVKMGSEIEYSSQKPSCSWALGILQGLSIAGGGHKLTLPNDTELLRCQYEYGYQEPSRLLLELKERKAGLENGFKQMERKAQEVRDQRLRNEGALAEAQYWHNKVAGWR